ncbi:MAG: hypothetical protein ACJ79H_06175 [Myxococcales bacterium]
MFGQATLALALLAAPSLGATRLRTPDETALKAFRLTTDNVRKAAAVARRLAAAVAKDPGLARSIEKNAQHRETLDAKAKALEIDPRVASALRAESISAREYAMVEMAALQAGMVAAMKSRGVQMDPADLREAINPANVAFVETHRKEMDELARSQDDLRKVSKAAQGEQK